MATLKQLSQQILDEKTNKVLSNKIEKDWQVFNITGNYTFDYTAVTEAIIAINGEEAQ